jgi:hypothetical protein
MFTLHFPLTSRWAHRHFLLCKRVLVESAQQMQRSSALPSITVLEAIAHFGFVLRAAASRLSRRCNSSQNNDSVAGMPSIGLSARDILPTLNMIYMFLFPSNMTSFQTKQ